MGVLELQKQILIESLRQRGFSEKILESFSKVKRENFIPKEEKKYSYEDTALPLGSGQTISQPYTIAMMLSLLELKKAQKVLEIGSGCGYVLALLSHIVGEKGKVFGIEIIKELAERSKKNLKEYGNVKIYNRNGRLGLEEKSITREVNSREGHAKDNLKGRLNASRIQILESAQKSMISDIKKTVKFPRFDRILISAASNEISEPLIRQLKNNGVIAAPLGSAAGQSLVAFKKIKGKLKIKKEIPGFIFVPLVGEN